MDKKPYQVCTQCVMDTSDPGITFDSEGVCDHCHDFHDNVEAKWVADQQDGIKLQAALDEIKAAGKGHEYDCLLGMSGGLDSSFMLHQAVKVYGLRPLVFHVDGGWNTPESSYNVKAMTDKLGVELKVTKIDWEEMRNFQLALFKSGTPYLDIAQDHCFFATLYNYAQQHKIKHILNGGNISTECVRHSRQYYYWGTDMWFINDVLKKFGEIPMKTYPFSSVFRHKIWLRYVKGVKVVRLLNYMQYSRSLAMKTLEKEYGWKDYHRKHFESIFTRYLEGYMMPVRYGYTPLREQLSALILTKQMTRDEAMTILAEPYPFYPESLRRQDRETICEKLRISEKELDDFMNLPKKWWWDYRNQSGLINFGAKVMELLGLARGGAR